MIAKLRKAFYVLKASAVAVRSAWCGGEVLICSYVKGTENPNKFEYFMGDGQIIESLPDVHAKSMVRMAEEAVSELIGEDVYERP